MTEDRTVLVTGATAGFGEAVTKLLAQEGWRVIATGRRQSRLDQLALGHREIFPLPFDIRDPTAIKIAIDKIPDSFLPIHTLVNNAGLALGLEAAPNADLENWDTMIDTNIRGLVHLTRTLLPQMVANRSGHIINIGSVAADNPYPGGNVYGATKAFVRQFSRNLRADLIGTGIRVTDIAPGLAETEFSIVRFGGDPAKAKAVYEGTSPLEAIDIARTVQWVMDQPDHVNVNLVEVMPTCQAWGPLAIRRSN